MAIRFGTSHDALLNAQLWATTTTGLVHLIEVIGAEASTTTVEVDGQHVTDTYGVLYGVHGSELDAFEAEHQGSPLLTLDTFKDASTWPPGLARCSSDFGRCSARIQTQPHRHPAPVSWCWVAG